MKYKVLVAAALTLLDSASLWAMETSSESRLARLATAGLHISGHTEPNVDHWREGVPPDAQSHHS